jgi:hypothetical protein
MATHNAPTPRTAAETASNVLSVRLPSAELRQRLAAQCEQDDVSLAKFIALVAEAYIDGRLRIIEKEPPRRPSFLIQPDADDAP